MQDINDSDVSRFIEEYDASNSTAPLLHKQLADRFVIDCILRENQHISVMIVCDANGTQYCLKRVTKHNSAENMASHAHSALIVPSRALLLRQEYDRLAQLSHPGIPAVYEFLEDDDAAYLIREYITGTTLTEYTMCGEFSWRDIARIGMAVCDILACLHAQSPPLIHRDIKGDNIIIAKDGRLALIDFDTAQEERADRDSDTVIMVTPGAAPPEQYGYRRCDARADIYALGVVMERMILSMRDRRAMRALPDIWRDEHCDSSQNIAAKDRADRSIMTATVPKTLRRIVSRCRSFYPDHRYRSAVTVRTALNHCLIFPYRTRVAAVAIAAVLITLLAVYSVLPSVAPPLAARMLSIYGGHAVRFQSSAVAAAASYQFDKSGETTINTVSEAAHVSRLYMVGDKPFDKWSDVEQYGDPDRKVLVRGQDIYVITSGITNLDDLYKMPNIAEMALYFAQDNECIDLTPIGSLNRLTKLALVGSPATNYTPLSRLESLTYLDLSSSSVTDLSPLAQLTKLTTLNISNTAVVDFSPLSGLPITTMQVHRRAHGASLANLPLTLASLSIDSPTATELTAMASYPALSFIHLHHYPFYDFTRLAALTSLNEVWVWGDWASLNGMDQLTALTTLQLFRNDGTPVDISPLMSLPSLTTLMITDITLMDYNQLTSLKYLERLIVSSKHIEYLPALPGVVISEEGW